MRRQPSVLFAWRVLILASELPPSARLVALVLSVHMDGDGGSCLPSLTTLSRESGLGRSTVVRALAQVEEAGLVDRGRGGRGKPTRYRATSPIAGLLVVPQRGYVVPQRDSTSATAGHEDVQESVHNYIGRAAARRQKKGVRTEGAHPSNDYLDQAGAS